MKYKNGKKIEFGMKYKHPFSAGGISPKPKSFAEDKKIDAQFVAKPKSFVKHNSKKGGVY